MSQTKVININNNEMYDVYIGRPSKWQNPFHVGTHGREKAIELFEEHLKKNPKLIQEARLEIQGKTLGCYCHPQPCHGDVWVKLLDEATNGNIN